MRFADFNLDGRIDMLVVCEHAGMHKIFEQKPNGKWRELRNERRKLEFWGIERP